MVGRGKSGFSGCYFVFVSAVPTKGPNVLSSSGLCITRFFFFLKNFVLNTHKLALQFVNCVNCDENVADLHSIVCCFTF